MLLVPLVLLVLLMLLVLLVLVLLALLMLLVLLVLFGPPGPSVLLLAGCPGGWPSGRSSVGWFQRRWSGSPVGCHAWA